MKVQRKLIKCSIFIFLLLGLSGCGKTERRYEDAQIVSIQYSYGSYNGGYYDFSVYQSNDKIMFSAFGKNGVELSWEHEVGAAIFSDFQQIIEDNKVVKWDGFRKSNRDILDGYSFSLNIEYNNHESIQAYGYEKYPKHYNEVSSVLQEYFFDIIEENTTFDRNRPFEKSTASDDLLP